MRALKALGVKKFVGIGYDFDDTSIVKRYFVDAGFKVLGLERLPVKWEDVGQLSSHEIYRLTKKIFLEHPGADVIYVQGGKLRMLDIVETLEQDLHVPVLHPGVATAWEIMLRLHVREPKAGYGRLLAELPAGLRQDLMDRLCPGNPAFFARSSSYGQPGHDGLCAAYPSRSTLYLARAITASRASCAIRTIRA